MQTQTTQPLPRYSQYTVRLANGSPRLAPPQLKLCDLLSTTTEFTKQPAETESAPNVIRLISAETECPPKVPICPHSAPKPKPKPKFGRPLLARWRIKSGTYMHVTQCMFVRLFCATLSSVEEFIITTPFLVEICIHIYWGRQGIFAKNLNSFFSKL